MSAGGCSVFPGENCQIDYSYIYTIDTIIIFVFIFLLIVAFIGYKYVKYLKFKKWIKSGQSTGEITDKIYHRFQQNLPMFIILMNMERKMTKLEIWKKEKKKKEKKRNIISTHKLKEETNRINESPLSKI